MIIDNFKIGGNKVYVIAEIGNNHNGSLKKAIELIDIAKDCGADCVKFQMRNLDELYRKQSLQSKGEDLGSEYIIDLIRKFELNQDDHRTLYKYSKDKKISYLCTPWDITSINILQDFQVPAFKISSADLNNSPLIDLLVETRKPLIFSTGMATEKDVLWLVNKLNNNKFKTEYALLHCNSTYPAPFHDINLRWLLKLKKIHSLIGYSGHERGINVSIGAVALGAKIIERHLTLDRNLEGPDHAASLEPDDFRNLIIGIRELSESLGSYENRHISQGEMINRENLGKSLVASKKLKKGHLILKNDVHVKSPGQGLSPIYFEKLIGKSLVRDLEEGDFFFKSDLENKKIKVRNYKFKMRWGLPVRYHDFNYFRKISNPDFFEFHLSYKDMNLSISDYFSDKNQHGFMVHAPELFKNSHLMDLASNNEEYRLISLKETQKVIDITRRLKEFFPNQETPLIIANIGGFSMDQNFTDKEKEIGYEIFAKSLSKLDLDGVELIPQTMAPFPWHFGGQRFQNLFVQPEEIVYWCQKLKLRVCLDVSHSMLTCNNFNIDFKNFIKLVTPYTAHIHLGDAKGLNGEGLQIGEGNIDFSELAKACFSFCPAASFIPEIWQGHKDNGDGFWLALNRLEGIF